MAASTGMALLAMGSLLVKNTIAQTPADEIIWGTVILTNFGDHIPLLSPDYSVLTALGARQMSELGSMFRERYVSEGTTTNDMNRTIAGISHDLLDSAQVSVTTMNTIYIQQSTQAFMAGLYPPLAANSSQGDNATAYPGSVFYNNTVVDAPVNGLQYPGMEIYNSLEQAYIFLNATENCPNFQTSYSRFLRSSTYTTMSDSNAGFLQTLEPAMGGAIPDTPLSLSNAYNIFDYLSHGQKYSNDIAEKVNDQTLQELESLASEITTAVFGNTDADGGIRTIGGAGLAAYAGLALTNNAQSNGSMAKITVASASSESIVALLTLLNPQDQSLMALPTLGSALAFELYSAGDASVTGEENPYPSFDDLRVRFLFRNGSSSSLDSQVILGMDGQEALTYDQFMTAMSTISSPVFPPANWCQTCAASYGSNLWCASETLGQYGLPQGFETFYDGNGNGRQDWEYNGRVPRKGLSAAVGGVIGAFVTLIVVGLGLVAAMLLFGIRFSRTDKGVLNKRSASDGGAGGMASREGGRGHGIWGLGAGRMGFSHKRKSSGFGSAGFREKLASDPDLPQGSSGSFGASVVASPSGHRRVESWELREGRERREEREWGSNGGENITPTQSHSHI